MLPTDYAGETEEMIQVRRLQEVGLVPKFTGHLAGVEAIKWAKERGLIGSLGETVREDMLEETPRLQGPQRLAGAVKGDGEIVQEALWEACSQFVSKVQEIRERAYDHYESAVVEAITALMWLVDRVMKQMEEEI